MPAPVNVVDTAANAIKGDVFHPLLFSERMKRGVQQDRLSIMA